MDKKDVIAQLLKQGAKQVKGLTVKNVTVTPQQEYTRLGLSLDKEVKGFRDNGDGTYEEAPVNVIFVSAFSVGSILKDNDEAAFAANHLMSHPDGLGIILSRAKIDIIQEDVEAGTEYRNPFASEDSKATVFDHNAVINHVVNIELSDFGKTRLDKLADKMMGF